MAKQESKNLGSKRDQGKINPVNVGKQIQFKWGSTYHSNQLGIIMDAQHPPVEEKQVPEKYQKKDRKKPDENKKPRRERPEYERNAELITIDMVLEPLPKKNEILAKPTKEQCEEKVKKCRDRVGKLIDKKKQIRAEKYKAAKTLTKGEGGVHDHFKEQIDEFKQMKERFSEARNKRDVLRKLVGSLIEQAKSNNNLIKSLRDASKNSKEFFVERVESLELRLRTDQLTKQEEKNLNIQITATKRKIKDAEPAGNIEGKLATAEQRKEELDTEIEKAKAEKEPLEKECNELKVEMDGKNQTISKLKGQIKTDVDQKNEFREKSNQEYEDWKVSKGKRLDEAELKIKQIEAEIKKIWDEFHAKSDAYWDQKHKLDFLEWQHRIQKRKRDDIDREKRRAMYEQKDKEREKEEQMKKFMNEVETCNVLITYLNELKKAQNPENKEQNKVVEKVDINDKISSAAEWKKEKGLEVLQSKKSKEDEAPAKKGKKNKNKNQEKPEEKVKFQIPIQIDALFDSLKLLAPESVEEIDKKIAELKDREALFGRACGDEVNEEDQAMIEKIKGKGKKEKKTAKKVVEDDFPTL